MPLICLRPLQHASTIWQLAARVLQPGMTRLEACGGRVFGVAWHGKTRIEHRQRECCGCAGMM